MYACVTKHPDFGAYPFPTMPLFNREHMRLSEVRVDVSSTRVDASRG
jgi:hypothetical protein